MNARPRVAQAFQACFTDGHEAGLTSPARATAEALRDIRRVEMRKLK